MPPRHRPAAYRRHRQRRHRAVPHRAAVHVGQSLPRSSDQLAPIARAGCGRRQAGTFRTLDIGGDKALPYMEAVIEEIPRSVGARSGSGSTGRAVARQIRACCGPAAAAHCASCPDDSEVAEFDAAKAIVGAS